ncbi:hypothetical protein D3C84_1032120 [compost metagenome]
MLARQIERRHQGASLFACQLAIHVGDQAAAPIEQLLECLQHQGILAFEMGIKTAHRQPGRAHHLAHARLCRPTLDQRIAGGLENAFTGLCLFIAHRRLRILRLKYYSYNNFPQAEILTAGQKTFQG